MSAWAEARTAGFTKTDNWHPDKLTDVGRAHGRQVLSSLDQSPSARAKGRAGAADMWGHDAGSP
jgi:hypothetical protein